MFSLNQEIHETKADEYSEFGKPYKAFPLRDDIASSCLPGAMWHNGELADLGMCPGYMSQKCATNWDQTCDMYLQTLDDIDLTRDFLQQTASKKYCRLADNSNCSIKCQPFNPINQESEQVCSYYGNETLIDGNQTMDIGYYTPVNLSPDYFGKCSLTCDVLDNLKDDDPVINNCLATGLCGEQMSNICRVNKGKVLNNIYLQTFCNIVNKENVTKDNKVSFSADNPTQPKNNNKKYILTALCIIILLFLIYKMFATKKR